MASARRTGTNESVSTYGAGQTYTVLATWESDTDNDNVTGTVSPVLECLAAIYDDVVNLTGAINNGTYFRIIRPKTGDFPTGVRDTGPCFHTTADSNGINFGESNSQIQDLGVRVTCNSATGRSAWADSAGCVSNIAVGCIFANSQNAGAGNNFGIINNQPSATCGFIDCLAENNEADQFSFGSGGTILTYCYNCTAINLNATFRGFQALAAGIILKNCLGVAGSGAAFNGSITMTNCASSDATATGTGARINQTFTFVNSGANDYHLASNDAGAKGFGTDLSADATFAFNDDIDRNVITSPWSIGFDWPAEQVAPKRSQFLTMFPV